MSAAAGGADRAEAAGPGGGRVDELLADMTLDEKLAQLGSAWVFEVADGVTLAPDRAGQVMRHGIGHVTRVSGASVCGAADAARLANEIQRWLVSETRLGIPAIVHEEVCSGLMARDAVVFPQAIGVASTWSPDLARAMADVTRAQMRAVGAHQGLSPVLDVSRDARWGRVEETFGEDPYLVARMGTAFVRGLQGGDGGPAGDGWGVVATAKHLVGYGASEGGLNWAPPHIGARELREVHLHPFEAVVREAGLASIMNGYHELDGVACGANPELLTTILRDEWGFDGAVVSDYFSIRQLEEVHHHADGAGEAAALALAAGVDVELPSTDCFGDPLAEAVRQGLVDEALVDRAVRRVLRTKEALGLFEQPYVDAGRAAAAFGPRDQQRLAHTVADKSLVLLRNDTATGNGAGGGDTATGNGAGGRDTATGSGAGGRDTATGSGAGGPGSRILPLAEGLDIALVGPHADRARLLFGDYTFPAHVEALLEAREGTNNTFTIPADQGSFGDGTDPAAVTILDELRRRYGDRVRYARGCDVRDPDRSGFDEAVALAADADVAVLVLGDKSGLVDDCTSGEFRDRASLDLPGVQEDLARAVVATGTPVVLVLVVGRPGGSVELHESCAATLVAWMPGQQGARAIADALSGVVSPGGKLPVTFPRSAGHVPTYYGHKPTGGRSNWKGDYADAPVAPLYPFGHGLSYTTFALSDVTCSPASPGSTAGAAGAAASPGGADGADEVSAHGEVTVRVTVGNTGERDGDEVVQLYVRRPRASVTRPVLELKGFSRVTLAPGEHVTVTFGLPMAQVGFHDRGGRYVVEPGRLDVLVGTSSRDLVEAGTVTIVPGPPDAPPPAKAFDGTVTVTAAPPSSPSTPSAVL
jgi:beta-xylosidase